LSVFASIAYLLFVGIIEAVRKLSRRASQMSARISQNIASSSAPQAAQDQLDDSVLGELFSDRKVGVQREFFGEEWTKVIRSDITRYLRNERISVLNKDGGVTTVGAVAAANLTRMCWVEPSAALTEQYAALAEVISQLHALPYELNRKSSFPWQCTAVPCTAPNFRSIPAMFLRRLLK
jgi:hypothetical protein